MMRRVARLAAGSLVAMACAWGSGPAASAAEGGAGAAERRVEREEGTMAGAMEAAYERFVEAVREAGEVVKRHPFYREPKNRASGLAFVAGMLIATLEEDLVQDPDFPLFRILDFRIREGGDNPDQRYAFARVRGDATYRIWGRRGGERRIELQVYAGEPWRPGGGRSISTLTHEQIRFAADGRFEILLSPERPAGSAASGSGGPDWMANGSDATELIVRQVYSDWRNESPGEIHIDRVGWEGRAKPVRTPEEMAARFDKAAADLVRTVSTWPDFVMRRYVEGMPPNTLSRPADPAAVGGVAGRFMSNGHFALAPDEALVVTLFPIDARYQGIQLTDPWFSSLEYANRQTSLTADQAVASADGAYRFVVSERDPGVPNWIDTTGLPQGTILIRFDGSRLERFPAEKVPQAVKVPFAAVRDHLPPDTPTVSEAERAAVLAERLRHVQIRFGK
ncbi:MAG: hypothetical protein R3F35_21725 [Myxococcota bacterium]